MLSLRASATRAARCGLHATAVPQAAMHAAARALLPLAACQARSAAATHAAAATRPAAAAAHSRLFHATAARADAIQSAAAAAATTVDVEASTPADSTATDALTTSGATEPADASGADGSSRKRSKIKIYSRVSDLKAAMRAEGRAKAEATALQERRAREEAEEDAALDEDPLERGPDGDVAAGAARAEAAALAVELKPSQLHGIAAKRLALQRIHPLKMLITSPRHGLDKVRIVPWSLARSVDSILKEKGFIAGLNAQTREKNYALWHVANRSAVEFAVLVRVFDEIVKRLPSLNPHSVLDYGSATGMTLAALQESLNKYANRDPEKGGELCAPVKLYRSVEGNAELARMATRLLEHVVDEEKITVQHRAHLPALPKAEPGAEAVPNAAEQSGVVVAPFSLGLLPDQPRRQKILDNLWASVQPGGVLVLVEPGSIEGFSTVRLAREYLLDKHGMRSMAQRIRPGAAESAANVVAPCGSNGVCPMGDLSLKRSCWFRTEILTSSLPLRTPDKHLRTKEGTTVESFSYLVLHKGPIRVSHRDATLALAKWQPKEKDIHEPGQQSWRAVAEREAEEIRARLIEQEEARIRAEQGEVEAEAEGEGAAQSLEVDAAAAEFNASAATSAEAAGAQTGADADADADAESEAAPALDPAPVTKRTDLAPLAHLLPSETVSPQVMFEHAGYSRIMRKPLKRGEHVVLDLCNTEAQLERRIVAKSYGLPYVLARAVSEGDLWPLAKRVRLATDPPGPGEKRRQEIAERKERRAARLASMDSEEAAAAKAELKASHLASKAALRAAKKQKIKEARDEAVLARGGDVRIPVKRSEAPRWELLQQMAQAERQAEQELVSNAGEGAAGEGAVEQNDDATPTAAEGAAASAAGVPPPIPRAKQAPKPRVAAPRTPAAAATATAADPAAPAPASDTMPPPPAVASAAAAAPKAKSNPADKPRGKIARSPSLMPDWMKTIMSQTRRAPGGLEYTGPLPPQPKLSPEAEAMDRDEDGEPDDAGEYSFEPDPTIRATKLRRLGSLPADQLTLQEAAELKRARMAAERLSDREARAASPLAFKRQLATAEFDEPDQSSSPADGGAEVSAAAPKESPAAVNAAAAAALGIRLPKWAAYRKIKNPTAPIARAPSDPTSTARGASSGGLRDASDRALAEHEERAWDSVMAEAARDGGDASRAASNAAARGSAGPSPSSSNFFKSEQVAAITSNLPPHLARLVNEASATPEAKHLAALAAQSRNMRDESARLASMRFHIRQHHKAKQAKAGGGGGGGGGAGGQSSSPRSAKKGQKRY